MKIVLFGYGKMGKELEKIALERGHEIHLIVDGSKIEITTEQLKAADVAIEFTQPESAVDNIYKCISAKLPIVVGTTGWYDKYDDVAEFCKKNDGSFLAATNFSIGVNLFFSINKYVAELLSNYPQYKASMEETHHTQKLDAPSGTAITLAEGIIEKNQSYTSWSKAESKKQGDLAVISHRIENVPGTHVIKYQSEIDDLEIAHIAHNRKGFALGAVIAAEFLKGKTGIFSMQDVLNK